MIKIDVAEFLKNNDKAKFKDLIQAAKPYPTYLIDSLITPKTDEDKLIITESLSSMFQVMKHDIRELYIEKLFEKLEIPQGKKALRKAIKKKICKIQKKSFKEGAILADPILIRPGIDFISAKYPVVTQDFMVITMLFDKEGNATGSIKEWVPKLITPFGLLDIPSPRTNRAREIIAIKDGKLGELALSHAISQSTTRWSKHGEYSISAYLDGNLPTISIAEVFLKIKQVLKSFWFNDLESNYDLVALYIILSYFHNLFSSIPYLLFSGIMGSGKSTILNLIAELSFNGLLVVDPSVSSIFRQVNSLQCTLVLDEQENVASAKDDNAWFPIIKSGYKKGAVVTRQSQKDINVTERFHTYGPKVIGNINGLDEVTGSRSIPISSSNMPKGAEGKLKWQDIKDCNEFQQIRDMLHCLYMQHAEAVSKVAFAPTKEELEYSKRDRELYHPIFVISNLIESSDKSIGLLSNIKGNIDQKNEQRSLNKSSNKEVVLKNALIQLIKENGDGHVIHTYDLQVYLNSFYDVNQQWDEDGWLKKTLTSLGVIRKFGKNNGGDHWRTSAKVVERDPKTFQVKFDSEHHEYMADKKLLHIKLLKERINK